MFENYQWAKLMSKSSYVLELESKSNGLQKEIDTIITRMHSDAERLRKIQEAMQSIETLLKLEGVSTAVVENSNLPITRNIINAAARGQRTSLAETLKTILATGNGFNLKDLVSEVEKTGHEFGDKNKSRAVGFTMLGLKRSGKYSQDSNGAWRQIA